MPRSASISVAVILTSAVCVLAPTAAHANSTNCSGIQASVGYHELSSTGAWGAEANIEVRPIPICITDTSSVNRGMAWAMFYGTSGGVSVWTQVGYKHVYGFVSRHYSQYNTGSGAVNTYVSSTFPSTGSTYLYHAEWQSSCGCHKNIVGALVISSVTHSTWSSPRGAWFGEASYSDSNDVPGTLADEAHFSSVSVQPSSSSTSFTLVPSSNITGYTQSPRYFKSSYSGSAFDIWTA